MIRVASTQKLLTPSGAFTKASRLKVGDKVFDANGKSHIIRNIRIYKDTNFIDEHICFQSKWWPLPVWLHKDHYVVSRNGTKRAQDINIFTDQHLFPTRFDWEIDAKLPYESREPFSLGYIIGAYLICGGFKYGRVSFMLPKKARVHSLDTILDHLSVTFPNYRDEHRTINNTLYASCNLNEYFKAITPESHHCTESSYMFGMYQSVVDLCTDEIRDPRIIERIFLCILLTNPNKHNDTMIAIPFGKSNFAQNNIPNLAVELEIPSALHVTSTFCVLRM